jgi:two-component system, OmpR family, sensor histidine kinase KdpD
MKKYEEPERPNPDELLASVKLEEESSKRARLKIFFGMCAGVGKTFQMLQSARIDKSKGIDIVVGYVEPHKRKETIGLLDGLEILPRKSIEYKGTMLQEMDLDAIIARHPHVVLVDELAHTNAPGCRHLKRFQDVQEILDNGIDVYTTLNIQHLESRADTVTQITGIQVRETIPDEIFEIADEVELVDITPEELLERFSEGKVYAPERSVEAIRNFFRKGNITALREMSLRLVADRVDKQLRFYMRQKHIPGPWKSGMRIMVMIGPSPFAARLLRWAKSLSYTMGGSLIALYVETSHTLDEEQKEQLSKNINLAKQLGAELFTGSGNDLVKVILSVAQKENVTHILIGKPRHKNLVSLFFLGNFIQKLIKQSGNIDIYVLGSVEPGHKYQKRRITAKSESSIYQYLITALVIGLTALACYPLGSETAYQGVSLILLFEVSVLATVMGIGPILMAALLSALVLNYFFIPPLFTFHIQKTEDVLLFGMYFLIALVNGVLTLRVRRQERLTRDREERTNALFELTKELTKTKGIKEVIEASAKEIKKYFLLDARFILQDNNNRLILNSEMPAGEAFTQYDHSVADWSFRHTKKAGKYTDTLPSSTYTFYPLNGIKIKTGVVAVKHDKAMSADREIFWDTCLSQISNAIEREFLDELARKAELLNESDKLYKTLFNSISHELRIPVATIMGAADTMLSRDHSDPVARELSGEIFKASERLNHLIENLLNMSRLESERITPRLDWCDVHDLVNKVNSSLNDELKNFRFGVVIPSDMPLVKIDFGLIEQVLFNLLINAIQYSPAGGIIRLKMFYDNGYFVMEVMDRGPGFPNESLPFLFKKFYRVVGSKAGGTGLGLSIVKGFTEAHKGTVKVENRNNGGAKFSVRIPSELPKLEFS